ncbi:MAG: beta-galactosidase [Saccharofermentanales bacterium]
MFEVKDRNFIINGSKIVLFGAEVHYFRLPVSDWEDRIIKAREAGCNLVSAYVPWMIHEDVEGDIDFEGRRRAENDLGLFISLIARHGMYCLLRPGPYVMSELIHEGIPSWMYTNHKGSLACGKDGSVHPTQSVYLLDEDYLDLIEKWYAAFGRTIRPYLHDSGGPVIMLQLDNEIGMMHWCSGTPDYTPANIHNFHKYLILSGNELPAEIDGMQSEEFFRFVAEPAEEHAAFVRDELSRFMRIYFREYFEVLQEKIYRLAGEVPVVLNVHGFDATDIIKRGKRYPIGVAQLSEAAKAHNTIMAGDYYIGNICYDNCQDIMLANAFTFAVQSPDQPLFSAEFQGGFQFDTPRIQPASYDLTTRICFADGMNGVNYYMFAGGTNLPGTGYLGHRHNWQSPVDTDGKLNPQYPVIAHLGRMLKACGESLAPAHKEAVVTLGLIPDYYMTEYRNGQTAKFCDELILYREEFLYEGMGKAMSLLNISYEGYDLTSKAAVSLEKHPAMAVFCTPYMDVQIQRRLADYVTAGGRLMLFPTVPVKDMLGNPCTVLADFLEVTPRIVDFGFADIDGVEEAVVWSATSFGDVENGFASSHSGFTCAFTKEIGQGKAVVFGIAMQHDFYYYDQIVLNLFKKMDVEPLFVSDSINDKLLLLSRANEEGGRYLFINNIDEYTKKTHFFFKGEALFGGKLLSVNPRSGLMLPLDIEFSKDLYIKYSTAEIIGFESTDNGFRLTISLTQPEDEIVLRTAYKPLPSNNYSISEAPGGMVSIISKLHGAINDTLDIDFAEDNRIDHQLTDGGTTR